MRNKHHLENVGRRETESNEFRIRSLPFLTGLSLKELRALHSRGDGLEAAWDLRGLPEATTTQTAGLRPYSASLLS